LFPHGFVAKPRCLPQGKMRLPNFQLRNFKAISSNPSKKCAD
jgi:hypothetical protein